MSDRIKNLIAKAKSQGHPVSVGTPGSTIAITKLEEFAEGQMPPSFLAFLQTYGSLEVYDHWVAGVLPQDTAELCAGTVVADTELLRSESELPRGFLVVGVHEDGAYCIDLNRRRSDGECPVVNFERGTVQHEKPVAETFDDWLVNFFLAPWTAQNT
jgi:hypothetical protein